MFHAGFVISGPVILGQAYQLAPEQTSVLSNGVATGTVVTIILDQTTLRTRK